MFWRKKRKADASEAAESVQLRDTAATVCHAKYANLDLRRSILDWRDRNTENAELHLSRELSVLYDALDEQLDKMPLSDVFASKKYGAKHLEPIFKSWVDREVSNVINAAQADLTAVFTRSLEFRVLSGDLDHEEGRGHYSDAAIAAGATGVGLAAIPTVATMSVVSAGGVMGFLGATVVAWPVVAVGVIAVGGLLALGGSKAADLKAKAISRFRKSMRKAIRAQVLGDSSGNESVCGRIQAYILSTADELLQEIDE